MSAGSLASRSFYYAKGLTVTTEAHAPEETQAPEEKFDVFASKGFAARLQELNGSIVFTTYQCGKIFFAGVGPTGDIAIFERTFPRAMGVSFSQDQNSFILGTLDRIYEFDNLLQEGETHGDHDAYYAPHRSWITGNIDIHDIAYDHDKDPYFCATRFNCLAQVSRGYSFDPVWRPSFITEYTAEDRCHLNGFAWREGRVGGGMVIDVASGEVVASGLSMPHSPRLHNGKLWILNSGLGQFGWVDIASGTFNPVCFCPGFARGLAFAGDYAIVGLSEPRHGKVFDGLPLQDALEKHGFEARCGIMIVDLKTGAVVDWLTVKGVVTELFDIDFLRGKRNVTFVGLRGDDIRKTFSLKPH